MSSFTYLMYLNVVTMIPNFIKENHEGLNTRWISVIISSYQISFLLGTPLVGKYAVKLGRLRVLLAGLVL